MTVASSFVVASRVASALKLFASNAAFCLEIFVEEHRQVRDPESAFVHSSPKIEVFGWPVCLAIAADGKNGGSGVITLRWTRRSSRNNRPVQFALWKGRAILP